jgi:hypothetical protein
MTRRECILSENQVLCSSDMRLWNYCNNCAFRGGDDFRGDSVHVVHIVDGFEIAFSP